MASRQVRNQRQGSAEGPATRQGAAKIFPEGQIPLDAMQQRTAIAIIQADHRSAKEAREAIDYGTSAKGDKLDFDAWRKQLVDLYFGRREPKTVPWKFASNRSMMIAMAIVEVLHARILPAVYNEELTRWRPGEKNDAPHAEKIEKLMFWWIRVRAKMREFFDRWVRHAIAYGNVWTEAHWQVDERDTGEVSEPQPITDEAGNPLTNPDGSPAIIPGQRIFKAHHTTRADVIPPEDVFVPKGNYDPQKDPIQFRKRWLFRELEEMERKGQAINITIPSVKGGRTLEELLPVTPVADSGDMNPDELKELQRLRLRNEEVEVIVEYLNIDFDGDGSPEPIRIMGSVMHDLYLGGVYVRDLSARGLRPIDNTMYLPRLDEPNGLRGLGVLEQIKELAMEIDALFNQITDANSLNVLRPGFYDPSGDLNPASLQLAPNRFTPVPRPRESVFFPEFNIPTERLIIMVRMVLEFIERLTAASAFVMGKESETVGGSGTATRVEAIVGSANVRHSVPMQRLREGASRIMTLKLDLVQKNLPEGMESRILGEHGESLFANGELRDIGGEFDAYLLPDESLGSKESERQLSQLLYSILTGNLIVASDPAKLYKVTADVLKSFGKDPEDYLGPAPEIAGAVSAEDEFTLILQGDFELVKPSITQNHIEHILKHQQQLEDPLVKNLNADLQAQVTQFLLSHIQQHAQLMQVAAVAAQQQQKGGGSQNGAAGNPDRGPGGRPGGAAPVGPEPGVGAAQDPLAASRATTRKGESLNPPR